MKEIRQGKILELLRAQPFETQEDLMLELRRIGIEVTQATISRDIKELGLSKAKGANGRYYYMQLENEMPRGPLDRMVRILRNSILEVDHAQNLVVIKTMVGAAHAAAAALDSLENPGLIGTLAGDDTVLLVLRSEEFVKPMLDKIRDLIS